MSPRSLLSPCLDIWGEKENLPGNKPPFIARALHVEAVGLGLGPSTASSLSLFNVDFKLDFILISILFNSHWVKNENPG